MNLSNLIKNLDYFLLLLVVIIFSFGIITIASATDVQTYGLTRSVMLQLVAFGIGIIAILISINIDYEIYGLLYWAFYVLAIGLLLVLYIPGVGVEMFGAKSWIRLGPVFFQTSEISKITYILFLAKFIEKRGGVRNLIDVFLVLLTAVPILFLLIKQPDLGTALVFVFIVAGMLFIGGMKYYQIGIGMIGAYFLMPFVYKKLAPHQKIRIDAFLSPDNLSLPGNYHVFQSKITIGSGGMYGKGLFEGVYHNLNYLPVKESDFIFSVFIEENGFVFGVILISLFFLFILRLLYVSFRIRDEYGSLIIGGIAFMFAFQIIENIGMTMGVMPVTGLTLPFVSYGATSVLSCMISIGIVQSIYARRKIKPHGYR